MECNHVVGIDLGTTTTLACYIRGAKLELVRFPGADTRLPSVIYKDNDSEVVVGRKAVALGFTKPWNMIRSSRDFIGTDKTWTCGDRIFTPTDVTAEILKEVKRSLVKALAKNAGYQESEDIGAVITVPAYFNSNQCAEIKKVGELAGFKAVILIAEPIAAAIAAVKEIEPHKKIFVLNINNNAVDMSVIDVDHIMVIAAAGDSRLGGDDFDFVLQKYFVKLIEDDTGQDLTSYKSADMDETSYLITMDKLLTAARDAKEELSESDETIIDVPIYGSEYLFEFLLSIDEFNEICRPLFDRIENGIRAFVNNNSKFSKDEISNVVLSGGGCNMRRIQDIIQSIFEKSANVELPLEELAVKGACAAAEIYRSIQRSETMEYNYVVGIDLGTTTTLACYMRGANLELVKFPGAGTMMPSVIYKNDDGEVIVGRKAVKLGVTEPWNMIRSSKTFMGDFEKNWKIGGRIFNPTDVATEILKEVKRNLVKILTKNAGYQEGEDIGAVITVPAYFNSNQTDETKKAGEAAGFKIIQIITEPMAAAVTAVREMDIKKKVFVLDLGGGTFDMSVLEANHSTHTYKAISTAGDSKLGGDDFDIAIRDYCINIIEDDTGLDLSSFKTAGLEESSYFVAMDRILNEARNAKEDLSDSDETTIDIANLFEVNGQSYGLEIKLSVDEFNDICRPLFDRIENKIHKFVDNNSKFKKSDLGEIILAGSSCNIRYIQTMVKKIFDQYANAQLPLGTLVVQGACHVAEASNSIENPYHIEDILSHSMGVEVEVNNKMILSKILEKDRHYPCSETNIYTTTLDNQSEIVLKIYEAGDDQEGEEDISVHNYYGRLILRDIEIAKAEVPKIEVTFQYDKSRCLTVTAVDKKINKPAKVEIRKGDKAVMEANEKPIDFVLLLDSSGSMSGREMSDAKQACHALVDEMVDFSIHRMALYSFDDNTVKHCGLSNNQNGELQRAIDNVRADGMTNMYKPLEKAYEELKTSTNDRVIIMVTDGYPTEDQIEAQDFSKELRENKGIRIVVIGAGGGVNMEYLTSLASEGDVYKINNMSELKDTFGEVMGHITIPPDKK